jgi:sterol 3beta-glucosyltransferase
VLLGQNSAARLSLTCPFPNNRVASASSIEKDSAFRPCTMPPTEEVKKRIPRKLSKKPKQPHRLPSTHVPERLRYGDDANEDVTAPARAGANAPQYMNQSIFSMIAAAGSRTDFNARFDDSSDSADEDEAKREAIHSVPPAQQRAEEEAKAPLGGSADSLRASHKLGKKEEESKQDWSEQSLLKSLPKLSLKSHQHKGIASPSPSRRSGDRSPRELEDNKRLTPRDAPMMSRMLEAQAELSSSDMGMEVMKQSGEDEQRRSRADSSPATLLATRLMEIFGFDEPETVVSEYPCWLLQTVLLQGYMYITRKHICFYAYLPKKSGAVAKSGYLSKRGRQNRKFSRHWFTLKGDVLSYYSSPSDLFFPAGNIDLRYGISASLSDEGDKQKVTKDFALTTDHRTYNFRADSHISAKEWVKTLQKVIFRSHNDGDSVKISLPIENVIDIEQSPVIDFAETLKIRVLEGRDSYAIDEVFKTLHDDVDVTDIVQYFFSFFSFGKDALKVLSGLIDEDYAQSAPIGPLPRGYDEQDSPRFASPRPRRSLEISPSSNRTRSLTPLRDTVKATLLPPSGPNSGRASPRLSFDAGRSSRDLHRSSLDLPGREYGRASFDRGRRAESQTRTDRPAATTSSQHADDSDSFVQSMDTDTGSSPTIHSPTSATQESASQILNRSDVFHSPTIYRNRDSPSTSTEDVRCRSEIPARANTVGVGRRSQSHSRTRQPRTAPRHASLEVDRHPSEAGARGVVRHKTSAPSLQEIMKAGSYPLQRAAGFAGYLKNSSTRMSKLLATESRGYLEKVSDMWTGAKRHYGDKEGIMHEDRLVDEEDEEAGTGYGDRFRAHFALPASEKLRATYFAYLHRVLPLYGKVYISDRKFCFRSLLPGTKTKMILPLKDIENVEKEKGFRFGYHGLVLVIRGHEELFFEFSSAEHRDDCTVTLLQNIESLKYLAEPGPVAQEDHEEAEVAKAEHEMLQEARRKGYAEHDMRLPTHDPEDETTPDEAPPILFDDPRASIVNFTPTQSLKITCLTIGSRGDVQPYIALCKGLLAEGHKPRIATHAEYEPWVRKHGIDFQSVDGDPAELMRICVENGMFTYSFLKEASMKFRSWIDDLLSSAWKACQGSDILVESPSAMAGIHIAEALRIPYFRAFTMPWTRTRAYPHAFAVPEHKIGGAYNYFSYVMFDNVFWKAIAGQVNRWRKNELGLRSTNMDKMQPNKVPFLYNFSPHVVVPPLDYSDWVRVTGYWFLDEASDWIPPSELVDFINRARADGKKLVYIGFGSVVVSDPAALTKTVVDSVLKADVRCILSKGWSDRLGDPAAVKTEVPLPPEIHQIKSAPHDWLFVQIDAAVHHGGAGTTGASLRAGIPTIIKPFFGDQFFFGSRVEDLGVGICMKKVNVSIFSRALWEAVHSERMIFKAKVLGEQIRQVSPHYAVVLHGH